MRLVKGRSAGQVFKALERRQGLHRPQWYAPTVVANSAEDRCHRENSYPHVNAADNGYLVVRGAFATRSCASG
jgi:hypothetical protein